MLLQPDSDTTKQLESEIFDCCSGPNILHCLLGRDEKVAAAKAAHDKPLANPSGSTTD